MKSLRTLSGMVAMSSNNSANGAINQAGRSAPVVAARTE